MIKRVKTTNRVPCITKEIRIAMRTCDRFKVEKIPIITNSGGIKFGICYAIVKIYIIMRQLNIQLGRQRNYGPT